ncbi:membrane protein [Sphaerisporangium siamense]|uniref:Uncharacterized membrane protein HdeD (DUF308 family) n=1 Tax=Sphaerisporangium siamense TaxID=795645 RepID=A0A7W7GAF2_9ACTN|nr:HdeD family acid-resistance protein [Sphaerisporangium siamense]MBB4701695.1 uncharacterized membrane protein HdeD (DUF308 family) [Sphaerisporangium siamense]GII84401.1 membrane protein [Sphaerisporangium siamense]
MRDIGDHEVVGTRSRLAWWMLVVRGICAVVFGVLAVIWPLITLLTLVVLFGAFAVVSGVLTLGHAFRGDHPRDSRTWMVVSGVLSILAGLIAWFWPAITALALLLLIAVYAVVIGVAEIVAAVRRRRAGDAEWSYLGSGVLAVIFGILLFIWPATGALAVTWLIGLFAIAYGIALLVLAYRIRDVGHRGAEGTAAHAM